jgi:DNA-binding IclR family transcriptional regulator
MSRRNQPRTPPYRAPALEKGMAILELLANAARPLAITDIAAALRRSRAEIYRMLVVLEFLDYLNRNEDGGYDLSGKLFDVASRHAPRRSVVAAARPAMEELAERTQQSCHLMVNSGEHMVCVAREESPAAIGFSVQVGFRPPILNSTSGRVYFAFQDAPRQELLSSRLHASGHAGPELRQLRAGAAAILRKGYATEPSRLTTGIHDLSAPVFGPANGRRGPAVACLSIPFVTHREFSVSLKDALPLLLRAAERISASLQSGKAATRR